MNNEDKFNTVLNSPLMLPDLLPALQDLAEKIGLAITVWDQRLCLVSANDLAKELLDYPADFFTPGTPYETFSRHLAESGELGEGDPDELVRQMVARAKKFEPDHIERTRLDGVVLDIWSSPLLNGGFVSIHRDISDKKISEKALEESEEQYRRTFEDAGVGMTVTDLAGRFIRVNSAFCEMLGYSEEEILAKSVYEITYEEDLPLTIEVRRQVSSDEGFFETYEKRYICKDRKIIWGQLNRLIVDDDDGNPHHIESQILNITERKEAELATSQSEARLSSVLETAVDGIVTISDRGVIESINPAMEVIFGYTSDELIGQNIKVLMPDPNQSAHDGYLDNYHTTGEAKIIGIGRDSEGQRKDGTVFPIHLAVSETMVGDICLFTGIIQDITARKDAEEKLLVSEQSFRAIFDLAKDGIFLIDLETLIIVDVNRIGAERLGYTPDELIGGPLGNISLSARDSAALAERLERIQARTNPDTAERKHIHKDGSEIIVEVSNSIVERDGRKLIQSIARDTTERAKAERAVVQAKLDAETATADKSRFLAAASHDLRQPLQALDLLVYQLANLENEPKKQDLIKKSQSALELLRDLLNSLFDISNLDSGMIDANIIDLPVSRLFAHLKDQFAASAKERNLELRFINSGAIVRSDPALLETILQNLIANALKYTEQGKVLVGCRRRGRSLSIEVHDTGLGISDEDIESIFQEFYQINNQARDTSKGLGLGLSIVKRLAKILGHRVKVRSPSSKGSVFSIEVATGELSGSLQPASVEQTIERTQEKLIIVIDDNQTVLNPLSEILRDQGFEVKSCLYSGSECDEFTNLSNICERTPDAIISDYRLPGTNTGVDAIKSLRWTFDAPIPALLFSGDKSKAVEDDAQSNDLVLLNKPVPVKELMIHLEKIL